MSELPKGWVEVPLSEVADVIRGVTYKKEQAINSPKESFIPVLRATNITGASLTFGELVYVPFDRVSETQLLRAGDVIIASSSGSKEVVGKAGSFTDSSFVGSFGAFCTVLRPTVYLSAKYFGFYFQTPSYRKSVSGLSSGSNINNLKTSDLALQRFSFPAQAEQTRIVAKLEELLSNLDAGVTELKAAQEKLAQYRQSLLKAAVEGSLTAEWRAKHKPTETGAQLLERILQERRARWEAKQLAKFADQGKAPPKDLQKKYPEPVQPDITGLPELPEGWVWATIDQLGEVVSGFAYKSTDFCSTGIPVTKIANIGYGVYESDGSQEFLPSHFLKETSDFVVSGGDILIALTRPITNGTLKSCLYPQDLPPSLLNQRVAAIKTAPPTCNDYIFLISRTPYFREKVRSSTSETLQPNMSPNALKAIVIPLPPPSETTSLVEITQIQLIHIEQQEVAISLSLKQSSAQRQNILRAAFAGQLVPQNPDDEPASMLLERIRAERAKRDALKGPRGRKTKVTA